jgi:hypothetical protein
MEQSSTRSRPAPTASEALSAWLSPDFTVIRSGPWSQAPLKLMKYSNILRQFPHVQSALHFGHTFWKSAAPAGFSLV